MPQGRLGPGVQSPDSNITTQLIKCPKTLALASRHVMDIRLKTLATYSNFQRTRPGLNAKTLQFLMCAQSSSSCGDVVGLGGLEPPASPLSGVRSNHLSYRPKSRARLVWWSLSGSNRRPPACKAGALPAELKPHCSNGTLPQTPPVGCPGTRCRSLVRTSGQQFAVFSL